jgi:hypothetical protein
MSAFGLGVACVAQYTKLTKVHADLIVLYLSVRNCI